MSGSFEILPKQYISGNYTQSVNEAVDSGGANFVSVQAWNFTTIASGSIAVYLQHANINDDSAYVDTSFSMTFTAGAATTKIVPLSGFGRYLRLRFVFTTVAADYLRAVIVLKDNP